jgi:tetratricopeptide (TPR) repeat protein
MAAALALVSPPGAEGADADGREQALRLARKAAADNPKEARDHLWLGQVATAVGQTEEAEKAFRQARRLDEKNPATWVALILFLASRDAKKAEAELTAAQGKLTKEQLPPVLAVGYEALGRLQEAEERYVAMLAANPKDAALMFVAAGFYSRTGQSTKAEPWLRTLLEPQLKAPESAVNWARRELALVLANKGAYPAFREALALLEGHAKTSSREDPDDRRVKALVLAAQPAHRREAISLLEKLPVQGSGRSPIAQFILARLYERDGNWRKARATMVALLSDHGQTPLLIAEYVRGLLRHKETDEAAAWVDKLTALAPKTFETLELRAFVLKQQGKVKEATDLVKAYASEKGAPLDAAALLLDRLGQADEAEALFRSFVATSKQPAATLLLAQHLSRRRLPEALALCEEAWKTCAPEAVALTSVSILRVGQAKEEDNQRVERWLTAAITKDPRSALLPVAYAQLQDARGRYDDAIGLYRKSLEQSPQKVVALNNLAYLLAFKEGKGAEALALAQRAIDLAGPDPEMLDTRAVIYLKAGQTDRAVQDLQQALAQTPAAAMYFHLAQAQHLAKNRREAVEAFRKGVAAGLHVDGLHPLERPAFEEMAAALKIP